MKAHKGDEIVCDCPPPAGRFRRDVEDGANILTDDIEITLNGGAHHDRGFVWVCPTCDVAVAQNFGDRWGVMTRNGWLE
jgi:hypothetical protein